MKQTRNQITSNSIDFTAAMLSPSADFGGLWTFENLPCFDQNDLDFFATLSYDKLCEVIFRAMDLELDSEILQNALASYKNFDQGAQTPQNAPLNENFAPIQMHKYNQNLYINELFHGPTRAFKDMALQPFGALMQECSAGKKYLILAATSGDTGPATLESFKGSENIRVVCLYPASGTSDAQRLQMVTQDAPNLKIIGINGNFDDAQSTLKNLLKDSEFKDFLASKQINLSAANSVNIARIAFQIIYHIYAYLRLLKAGEIQKGEKVNIIVPSGNFGNILGAFYAKIMGLPFNKLVCASNANNVLTEFITRGVYDARAQLKKTISPAMDIIKSSNVERVLFELFGFARTRELMEALDKDGIYRLNADELEILQDNFVAGFCDDESAAQMIVEACNNGYMIDPHTACGLKVWQQLQGALDDDKNGASKSILCSTAQWCKFAPSIANALGMADSENAGDLKCIDFILGKFQNLELPESIASVFKKPIVHNDVMSAQDVKAAIMKWLD